MVAIMIFSLTEMNRRMKPRAGNEVHIGMMRRRMSMHCTLYAVLKLGHNDCDIPNGSLRRLMSSP